jgi:hypothetical protein
LAEGFAVEVERELEALLGTTGRIFPAEDSRGLLLTICA